MTLAEVTEDLLLGGRVRLVQPRSGYRAATDPVFLAAAVTAEPGQRVLDLGCGAGAASLCLAARVPGVAISGLEIQAEYLEFAARNAALNDVALDLHPGDVAAPPKALKQLVFDHVMLNPPFYAQAASASPVPGRDRANRETGPGLRVWIDCALARLAPRGWLTVINRAERLPDLLTVLRGRAGDIAVKPLAARDGREAKRVILRARKSARGPFRLHSSLVLHTGPMHLEDGDDYSAAATAILRHAAPLRF